MDVVEFCEEAPPFAAVEAVLEVALDFADVVEVDAGEAEPTDNDAPPGEIPCPYP